MGMSTNGVRPFERGRRRGSPGCGPGEREPGPVGCDWGPAALGSTAERRRTVDGRGHGVGRGVLRGHHACEPRRATSWPRSGSPPRPLTTAPGSTPWALAECWPERRSAGCLREGGEIDHRRPATTGGSSATTTASGTRELARGPGETLWAIRTGRVGHAVAAGGRRGGPWPRTSAGVGRAIKFRRRRATPGEAAERDRVGPPDVRSEGGGRGRGVAGATRLADGAAAKDPRDRSPPRSSARRPAPGETFVSGPADGR